MVIWLIGRLMVNIGGRICVFVDRLLLGKLVSDVLIVN